MNIKKNTFIALALGFSLLALSAAAFGQLVPPDQFSLYGVHFVNGGQTLLNIIFLLCFYL